MADTHSAFGVLQALIVLAPLLWTWGAFVWLANQAPAGEFVMRIGMSAAMIAVFIAALTIPEAYEDLPGGWYGPLVFVIAYTVVRVIHASLYVMAAGEDAALRRQVLVTQAVAMVPAVTAMFIGVALGPAWQTWIWLAAWIYDAALTYASSREGDWRIHSVAHWAERYGLVVILALGESIIAVGVGVAREPIDGAIALGAALALTLSILLWWAYFGRLADAGEHELERRSDAARVRLAINGYTYVHLVIVAGVVLAALGVEEAMAHIGEAEPLGWFGASVLAAGLAAYLAATAVFARLIDGRWPIVRVLATLLLAASVAVLAVVPSMAALAIAVVLVAAVAAVEGAMRTR
jgi:low temperature requirement protein LtrA